MWLSYTIRKKNRESTGIFLLGQFVKFTFTFTLTLKHNTVYKTHNKGKIPAKINMENSYTACNKVH